MIMRDRWQNWDQLAVGEDFWDMLAELDRRQTIEKTAQLQADQIQQQQERRLAKKKIDRAKFMEEEPYSFMCKVPEAAV